MKNITLHYEKVYDGMHMQLYEAKDNHLIERDQRLGGQNFNKKKERNVREYTCTDPWRHLTFPCLCIYTVTLY